MASEQAGQPYQKEQTMTEYLTLEEADAGRRTTYISVAVTAANRRAVLKAMRQLIEAGETSVTRALDKAGDNTDNGSHFLCRYDLRQSVGRELAKAASELNKAKRPNKPINIVSHALDTLETPRKLVPGDAVRGVFAEVA